MDYLSEYLDGIVFKEFAKGWCGDCVPACAQEGRGHIRATLTWETILHGSSTQAAGSTAQLLR